MRVRFQADADLNEDILAVRLAALNGNVRK
jgi:hypothetical protein